MDELEEFLEPVEEVEAEAVEPEVEAEPAEPVEEAPKEEPTEPDTTGENVSTPETVETHETQVPLAALTAEREKRQIAEQRLAEQQPAEQKKDFFEDPEGALNDQKQSIDASLINMKVDMSVEILKTVHADYTEVVEDGTWNELVQNNPSLQGQAFKASNPAAFAYQQCQSHKLMKEIGDPKTYKDRIKAEALEEIKVEAAAKALRDNIPESLASATAATTKQPAWSGPESLEELFD